MLSKPTIALTNRSALCTKLTTAAPIECPTSPMSSRFVKLAYGLLEERRKRSALCAAST